MGNERIDAITALRYLSRAVAEKGADYVDPGANAGSCSYFEKYDVDTLTPSCIVGHVLFYGFDELICEYILNDQNTEGVSDLEDEFTEFARWVLEAAQEVQDRGDSWGDALSAAVDRYGEYLKDPYVFGYDEGKLDDTP